MRIRLALAMHVNFAFNRNAMRVRMEQWREALQQRKKKQHNKTVAARSHGVNIKLSPNHKQDFYPRMIIFSQRAPIADPLFTGNFLFVVASQAQGAAAVGHAQERRKARIMHVMASWTFHFPCVQPHVPPAPCRIRRSLEIRVSNRV